MINHLVYHTQQGSALSMCMYQIWPVPTWCVRRITAAHIYAIRLLYCAMFVCFYCTLDSVTCLKALKSMFRFYTTACFPRGAFKRLLSAQMHAVCGLSYLLHTFISCMLSGMMKPCLECTHSPFDGVHKVSRWKVTPVIRRGGVPWRHGRRLRSDRPNLQ